MECKRCKNECMESELTNGFCNECVEKYGKDEVKLKKIENSVASFFKHWSIYLAIFVAISGLLATIYYKLGIFTFLLLVSADFIFASFLRAIAEIIQLLEEIKNK